jgi:hypothetical protein
MAQALPVHIVSEIERRWQRRLDAQPQVSSNDDSSAAPYPLCSAPASVRPAIPGKAAARRDHVCSDCGHAWHPETD